MIKALVSNVGFGFKLNRELYFEVDISFWLDAKWEFMIWVATDKCFEGRSNYCYSLRS
jgi:hypothetical protein